MEAYIYQADLWCEACGDRIRQELTAAGKAPSDPEDESSYDSDDFPKGPYPEGGGEADTPQHCGAGPECLLGFETDGHLVGAFLENPLTDEGRGYVLSKLADNPSNLVFSWATYYGLSLDYSED